MTLQEGNDTARSKIQPKKSWEIEENLIGITPEQAPRSYDSDFQPFHCINLLDGNPETYWVSRAQADPDVQPEWIRIDLARETPVREVVLVPKKDGKGMPRELSIRLSRDAWHWNTVYETKAEPAAEAGGPLRVPVDPPQPAKQVWIIGNQLPFLYLPDDPGERREPSQNLSPVHMDHKFALAEVRGHDHPVGFRPLPEHLRLQSHQPTHAPAGTIESRNLRGQARGP